MVSRYYLALAFLLVACPAAAQLTGVPRVVDGDTLAVAGERVRLHAIDAPERGQRCGWAPFWWRCGEAAAAALAARIDGRAVECAGIGRDRWGRLIATCRADGEDLGAAMVRAGWAVAYRRYSDRYVVDEEAAHAARVGVWSAWFRWPWEARR